MDIPSSNTNMSYAANIFAEYEEFIHNVILYKMKDEANADDLHQDFFLSLASKLVPPNVQIYKMIL